MKNVMSSTEIIFFLFQTRLWLFFSKLNNGIITKDLKQIRATTHKQGMNA